MASNMPWGYSRSPILAKCRRFTQEILLRGFGVMKTTMTLMGRPDLCREASPGPSSVSSSPGWEKSTHDPQTHLSGFPGSRRRRRHLLAEWISSSFTFIILCRAKHQSWATVMFRFWRKSHKSWKCLQNKPESSPNFVCGALEDEVSSIP